MSHSYTGRAGRRTSHSLFSRTIVGFIAVFVAFTAAPTAASANSKYAGIVVDAKTGRTLYSNHPDSHRYPASLTKMMTLYLTFEALDAGKISLNTPVPVTRHAANEPPSKLGLRPGQTITVDQVIRSLVTRSANDAATALGEFLGGSESAFGQIMTNKAHALGMSRTTFRNANGLPDRRQKTTARDMATLGIALREHFPRYYHYFATRKFVYKGDTIGNHNRLLGSVEGVDGIKTGFTNASGFNLVTSLKRDGRSIVAVVMGGRTGARRDRQMRELVAEYLPKASRSGTGNLVAETQLAPTHGAIKLPKYGPLPRMRYPSSGRVALAYANETSTAEFPLPDPRPVVGRRALIKTLRKQQAAVRSQAPQPAAPTPAVAVGGSKVDAMTTGSTPATGNGWIIQIGATPDEDSALSLLARAKSSNGKLLADAHPFTVEYTSGGNRLYRARFNGFSGKKDAWTACSQLKKSGYGCWASLQ